MFTRSTALSIVAMSSLAACGGGGGGTDNPGGGGPTPTQYVAFAEGSSTATSPLQVHLLDSTAGTLASGTGSLARGTDRISIASLDGDIDSARAVVTLDDGGTITITGKTTDFVATFSAQPSGENGNSTTGVVGIATAASDIPTNDTASYGGISTVTIIDGGLVDGPASYELTGLAVADVTFTSGAGDVDLTFSGLRGTRTGSSGTLSFVTDVAVITIDDAVIANGAFSGGTATFTSDLIQTELTTEETVATSGGFFGPDAVEIGGVFMINDTPKTDGSSASGTLLIQGGFAAN